MIWLSSVLSRNIAAFVLLLSSALVPWESEF